MIGNEVMSVKINTSNMQRISYERSLRFDCVYQRFATKRYSSNEDYYRFNDLFDIKEEKIKTTDLNSAFQYCQIGDVEKTGELCPVTLNFDIRNIADEDYYKKIEKGDIMKVSENDILMSFLLPQDSYIKGKFTRINISNCDVYFSTAFLRIVPRKCPELLYYCLQSIFYGDLVATARIRKGYTGYATLSSKDLQDMRFARKVVDSLFAHYDSLKHNIEKIEKNINNKKNNIKPISLIIDSIFQREFGFDYDKFDELKSDRHYISQQFLFSNNPDLRFSAKFHRPAGDFVMEQLTKISDKKIKHFISEPIILGASISPKDFDKNGSSYYISMASIKNLEIELDDGQLISDSYFSENKNKTLQINDIVIARSGVAIGKVAIVKNDFDGIFADFTMRIRINEQKCSPLFAYYYFRSSFFQYLIEIYKKGLQNQNIFPIVIQEFPIPDISLSEQQRIVDEIQSEIKKQDDIKLEIASLRNKIDDIIIQTVSA